MESWEQILSKAGHRITGPRRVVMQILAQTEVPLSPQEIFERGRGLHQGLGLVTVYRTLDLFEHYGLACRVHLKEGCHGYLAASPGHRHVVLCKACGRSVDFPGHDDLALLIARVEEHTGYHVDAHLLQLFGVCPSCNA